MRPPRLSFAHVTGFYRAYARFLDVLRTHHVRTRLEPGDVLLYDNHRMLHGRTAFEGLRWVRGVYFDEPG
jgi:alpha-ketoglutarate-dependent taurine dioxygenase